MEYQDFYFAFFVFVINRSPIRSTQFISIARTEDEISLILEEDMHKSITEGGLPLESSGIVWRAIQVNEGAQGFSK